MRRAKARSPAVGIFDFSPVSPFDEVLWPFTTKEVWLSPLEEVLCRSVLYSHQAKSFRRRTLGKSTRGCPPRQSRTVNRPKLSRDPQPKQSSPRPAASSHSPASYFSPSSPASAHIFSPALQFRLSLGLVDLLRMQRRLRQNRHPLRQHLDKAPRHKEPLPLGRAAMQPNLARTKLRQQRSRTVQRLHVARHRRQLHRLRRAIQQQDGPESPAAPPTTPNCSHPQP